MPDFRTMKNSVNSRVFYESKFDMKTGTLTRVLDVPSQRNQWGEEDQWEAGKIITWSQRKEPAFEEFSARYPHREVPFSPVPETVDVAITDKCGFGCTYCYMDSRPKRPHGPKELVERIITGFDQPPYQMAIGGGEPTEHPDLPWILRRVRELGVVPNYTTNGDTLRDDVVEATNEVCGSIAMTYHSFKGPEWFAEHYAALRSRVKVGINIHLIASKGVAENLDVLNHLQLRLGKLRVVLLAYYPDVGRGQMEGLLTKRVYTTRLPEAIRRARDAQMDIAYSEGLLPFFFSRPELNIETRFAMRSEGRFSCYFDTQGRMSHSSFSPPQKEDPSIYEVGAQKLWDGTSDHRGDPRGDACYECEFSKRCSTPTDFHYLVCGFADSNETPPKAPNTPQTDPWAAEPMPPASAWARLRTK